MQGIEPVAKEKNCTHALADTPSTTPSGLKCYAQGEHTVRLGAFECEGGSSDAYLATAVSGGG